MNFKIGRTEFYLCEQELRETWEWIKKEISRNDDWWSTRLSLHPRHLSCRHSSLNDWRRKAKEQDNDLILTSNRPYPTLLLDSCLFSTFPLEIFTSTWSSRPLHGFTGSLSVVIFLLSVENVALDSVSRARSPEEPTFQQVTTDSLAGQRGMLRHFQIQVFFKGYAMLDWVPLHNSLSRSVINYSCKGAIRSLEGVKTFGSAERAGFGSGASTRRDPLSIDSFVGLNTIVWRRWD